MPFTQPKSLQRSLVALTLAAFFIDCSGGPLQGDDRKSGNKASKIEIAKIASSYQSLRLMTPKPVFSNPQLAMLCVGATKEMVDHARVEMGPHAHCAVRIFMNDLASTAFETGRDYQVGSVIVKEKQILGYRTGASPGWQGSGRGIGGMIKRVKGYDESNGDWEYFYLEDPSSIESGKMKSCIECHKKARASDFVFGAWHEDEND